MAKKQRILVLSLVTVMLALAVVVAATYALFSETVTIHNHLQAGTLKVQLYRTSLTTNLLDDEGKLTVKTTTGDKEFTDNSENLFDLGANDVLVPTSSVSADMELRNSGDVAVGYYVQLVITDGEDTALAQQLKLTVTAPGKTATAAVKDGLMVGSASNYIATVAKGAVGEFTVTVEFENKENSVNNQAKTEGLSFDLIVYAIQAI